MTEVKKKAPRKKAVKKPIISTRTYYNASDVNIFTEQGRVRPTETIIMTTDEASRYLDLVEV